MHGASDSFLDEVRSEVGFVAEFIVESVPSGRVDCDTLSVGAVRPTELGSAVGAVKELPGGFVEVVAALVRNNEFDRCGTPDLHISDLSLRVLKRLGVG